MSTLPFTPCSFSLNDSIITLGRDADCTVVLRGAGVSRLHAAIEWDGAAPRIRDRESTFGIRVNDRPTDSHLLADGDEIVIGTVRMRVSLNAHHLRLEPVVEAREPLPPLPDARAGCVRTIGRDSSCDVECNHPLVSRFHATLADTADGGTSLTDNQSANGTWVNGRQIRTRTLVEGDIVQIGPFRFSFDEGLLLQAEALSRIQIEAFDITVMRGKTPVLRNVSLSVQPGAFTALLGPSGAGKSTLACALTGQVRLDGGRIYYNGLPFHTFWAAFRSSVGFVAQSTLLYDELTVQETLQEQSLIRLPGDSVAAERMARIDEVLELLELTRVRHHQIRRLSGGQARRVHVGIELLASPPLVVLDEPLAGLDSGLISSFMHLFRRICDRGHTILMATHALEQLELCDTILFISDGRVCYDGPAGGLAPAFGVQTIAQVYDAVKQHPLPAGKGENDRGEDSLPPPVALAGRERRHRGASPVRQFPMLVRRYTRILVRDLRTFVTLLAQPVLIALLLTLVYGRESTFFPLTFHFCLTVSAIWIGGISSVRAIARDGSLIARQTQAGLSVGAYLGAQVLVYAVGALVQAALFSLSITLLFPHHPLDAALFVLTGAGCVGGALTGLLVGALSATVNRAVSWLPVVFIPQIFFSGILIPFDRMTAAGRLLSHLTVSRGIFALFRKLRVLELDIWSWTQWRGVVVLLAGICIFLFTAGYWRFGGSRPRVAA